MINMMQELQRLVDEAPYGAEYVCVDECEGKLDVTYFKHDVGICSGRLMRYDTCRWEATSYRLGDLSALYYDNILKLI